MAQVQEIKCPHCGEWTMWRGHVDDRCLFCSEFLEPQRFSREVEDKVSRQVSTENDYFFIKPGDGAIKRRLKTALNSTRWIMVYLQVAFFSFISFLLVLLSLLAG